MAGSAGIIKIPKARHSFAMMLMDNGFDLEKVAALLGVSVKTSANYGHITNKRLELKINTRLGQVISRYTFGRSKFTFYLSAVKHVPFAMRIKSNKFSKGLLVATTCALFSVLTSLTTFSQITNYREGVWSDASLWENFKIPADTDVVYLSYGITIDINVTCKTFNANANPVTVNPGVKLSITGQTERGFVTDIDGNTYKTIGIGTQTWMAENLKTTHYNNGAPIPHITEKDAWEAATIAAYCDYNNDTSLVPGYGRLYNWWAASDTILNICPQGWHIASDSEWNILLRYLTARQGGGKMREPGFKHWTLNENSYTGATNSSEFTALAAGYRMEFFGFVGFGNFAIWWTSTESEYNSNEAHQITIGDQDPDIFDFISKKLWGQSCRCLKDK